MMFRASFCRKEMRSDTEFCRAADSAIATSAADFSHATTKSFTCGRACAATIDCVPIPLHTWRTSSGVADGRESIALRRAAAIVRL